MIATIILIAAIVFGVPAVAVIVKFVIDFLRDKH